MRVETRPELPEGYRWQEVPEFRAAFPRPDGWHYKFVASVGVLFCAITKEPITIRANDWRAITEEQGYRTGLAVHCIAAFQRKTGRTAGKAAKEFLTDNSLIRPMGELVHFRQEPLVMWRGYVGSRMSTARGPQEIRHYVQTAANIRTGTFYLLDFESYEEDWEENEPVAKVMIEKSTLSHLV